MPAIKWHWKGSKIDGYRALRISHAILESARTGETVGLA